MVARAKSTLLVLGWTLFSAAAVLVTIVGVGHERLVGIAFVLFMGVGVPAIVGAQRLSRPRERAIRSEAIRFRGAYREALVCRYSKRKHWLAFVGSCAMAAAGVLMFIAAETIGDDQVTRWLLRISGVAIAAMFTARAVYDIYIRWGSRRYVALLPEGILHQAVRPIFVPWYAVEGAGVFEWKESRGAGIRVTAPDEVEAPWWARRAMRSNRAVYGVDLVFLELEASPDDLAETIERQLAAAREAGTGDHDLRLPTLPM